VTAVRHNGETFVLRCDTCGVETERFSYSEPFPVGWEPDGEADGVRLHICGECRFCGPADRASFANKREAS
jgi:hypothetical protein